MIKYSYMNLKLSTLLSIKDSLALNYSLLKLFDKYVSNVKSVEFK